MCLPSYAGFMGFTFFISLLDLYFHIIRKVCVLFVLFVWVTKLVKSDASMSPLYTLESGANTIEKLSQSFGVLGYLKHLVILGYLAIISSDLHLITYESNRVIVRVG
jgi:hypothetical protein